MAHVVVGLVAAAVVCAVLIPYGVGWYVSRSIVDCVRTGQVVVQGRAPAQVVELEQYRYERWRR